MYELWIKNNSGEYQLADLGDDIPSMTYQANDIAELENRQASYSLSFKLPKTKKNCEIFEFSNIRDAVTNFPYNKQDCRLYSNNRNIAGEDSIIILDKITDHFECQILSGIASFFDSIKDRPMEDLHLSDVPLGQTRFTAGFKNNIYTIPAATYNIKSEEFKDYILMEDEQFQVPAVFVEKTMQEICSQNKVFHTLKHNLGDDNGPNWKDLAVGVCDLKTSTHAKIFRIRRYNDGFSANDIVYDPSKSASLESRRFCYNPKFNGELTLNLSVEVHLNSDEPIHIFPNPIKQDGQFIFTVVVDRQINGAHNERLIEHAQEVFQGGPYKFEALEKIKVEQNHTINILADISFRAPGTALGTDHDMGFNFEFTGTPDVEAKPGNMLPLSKNLGFKTQFDYFKAICQALGLTVNIAKDERDGKNERIVELYTLKKLYDNKIFAKDWTEKLHSENLSDGFTIKNYARENHISFKKNDNDGVTNTGKFSVDNKTLEKEKKLFDIDFESGTENRVIQFKSGSYSENISPGIDTANIPLFNMSKNGSLIKGEFKAGKPHFLKISPATIKLQGKNTSVYAARHVNPQDLIDDFYKELTDKMLNNARVLEAEFLLDENDIDAYNKINPQADCSGVFIPIYLKQTGAYYYINKISNFQSGKLTKVELIKM